MPRSRASWLTAFVLVFTFACNDSSGERDDPTCTTTCGDSGVDASSEKRDAGDAESDAGAATGGSDAGISDAGSSGGAGDGGADGGSADSGRTDEDGGGNSVITSGSCAGMGLDCMDDDTPVSCCDSALVTGGVFPMGRCGWRRDDCSDAYDGEEDEMPEHDATVSDFSLDTFEVTVGRFRKFVDAYADGWRPSEGQGAHPLIAGSGWQSDWDGLLPIDGAALRTTLNCDVDYQTWTDAAGAGEQRPMSCVDWYQAFAFCAWDGGRLPTEAEWEYAAAGGSENRLYPWTSAGRINTMAVVGFALVDGVAGFSDADIPSVGSRPLGRGRYGEHDLAGSMQEWTLDGYDSTWYAGDGSSCTNCANLDVGSMRVCRGGSWIAIDSAPAVRSAGRAPNDPGERNRALGLRCAR
jgi:sulfatase modifying factor 1